jgi:hypothetical protein
VADGAVTWNEWATSAVDTLTMTPGATDADWVALFAPGGTYQDPVNNRTEDVASVFAMTRDAFADWSMRHKGYGRRPGRIHRMGQPRPPSPRPGGDAARVLGHSLWRRWTGRPLARLLRHG